MKKIFIIAVILMCCTTLIVLGASSAFGTIEDEGYAVPTSAGISKSLSEGGGAPVSLVGVRYGDVVYSTLTGYYVGEDRAKIDVGYPLYVNGGTGVRFLGEDNWLITVDADLYQSFEGLYVSEGISYNSDMTRADEEEFILLALSNGLYMNAQQAVFTGPLGSTVIPANSILSLKEESICWYQQNNGTLSYAGEEAVFGAEITIGSHSYNYVDLLDALGLINEAIEQGGDGQPAAEKLDDAAEILNGKEDSGEKNSEGVGTALQEAGKDAASAAGESGGNAEQGGSSSEGSSSGGSSSEGSSSGGSSGSGGEGGSSEGSSSEGSSGSGDEGESSGDEGESSGDEGESSGDEGESSGDEGESSGDEGEGEGSGGSEGSGGGGGQGTGGSGGSGTGGGESGGSQPVAYQQPTVTLTGIRPWSYAISIDMEINDRSASIYRGVSFAVYKSVKGSGATAVDGQGYTVYPAGSYEGKSTMLRKNKTGAQSFALSTLQPGQTVYLQYSFRYNAEVTDTLTDTETGAETEVTRRVRKYYYSDLIEITLPTVEEGDVKTLGANWTEVFAAQENALKLDGLSIANTSDFDSGIVSYDFDNFILNTLPYVNRLELTLTPKEGGEVKTVSVGSLVLARAKVEGGTTFTSTSPALDSNTEYSYTVKAKDRWGNDIPLTANGEDGYSGRIYTRKLQPTASIKVEDNETDILKLKITVTDTDGALTEGQPLYLAVADKKRAQQRRFTEAGIPPSFRRVAATCMSLSSNSPLTARNTS